MQTREGGGKDMSKTGRWLLVGCVLTALVCLAALALWPAAVEQAPYGDALQMVLIDIGDDQAAASYHVKRLGVYVLSAGEGGQAYAAGVRAGDRLVMVDGKDIATTLEFAQLQEGFSPGQRVCLSLRRGHENLPVEAEILWDASESD